MRNPFHANHSWESVLVHIVEGLENGSVTLDTTEADKSKESVAPALEAASPLISRPSRWFFVVLCGVLALVAGYFYFNNTALIKAVWLGRELPDKLAVDFYKQIACFFLGIGIAYLFTRRKRLNARALTELTKEVSETVEAVEKEAGLPEPSHARLRRLSQRLREAQREVSRLENPW